MSGGRLVSQKVFEHNLRLLLRRAWKPVRPDRQFSRRLEQACEARMVARHRGAKQPRAVSHTASWPWLTTAFALAALCFVVVRPLWQTPRESPSATRQTILAAGEIALRTPLSNNHWHGVPNGSRLTANEATYAHVPEGAALSLVWDSPNAKALLGPNSSATFSSEEGLFLDSGTAEVQAQRGAFPITTPKARFWLSEGEILLRLESTASEELLILTVTTGRAQLQGGELLSARPQPFRLRNGALEEPSGSASQRTTIPAPKERTPAEDPKASDQPKAASLQLSIQSPKGLPIPRARLWTRAHVPLPNVSDALHQDIQSTSGTYSIDLDPGDYTIAVEAQGFAPFLLRDLNLQSQKTRTLEITLKPGRPISGYVVAAGTGAPLQDALVVIEDLLPHQVLHAHGQEFSPAPYCSAVSDSSGHWIIPHAPEGRHTLRASALGYAPLRVENSLVRAGGEYFQAQEFATMELSSGGTLEGLVQRLDGSPWPSAAVIASRIQIGAGDIPMTYDFVETNSQGHFRIEALPEGQYIVLLPQETKKGKSPRFRNARIAQDETTHVLFQGRNENASGVRLQGRLLMASGQVAAHAQFTLTSVETKAWQSTTADSEGHITLIGVLPGEYEVALGLRRGYESLAFLPRILVEDRPEQFIEFKAGSSEIHGHANKATGGFVFFQGLREGRWQAAGTAQVDRTGRFHLLGLHAGTLRGTFFGRDAGEGYAWIEDLHLEQGKATHIDIPLTPAGSLEIVIHNSQGKPAKNTKINLTNEDGQPLLFSDNARTDSAGQCTIPIIPEGVWTIQAKSPQGSTLQVDHFVAPGDSQELRLVMDSSTAKPPE